MWLVSALVGFVILQQQYKVSAQSTKECSVSFNTNLLRKSDSRLIGGYNDVIGPVQNLTYFDDALILSSNMLYNGILRHPGGTVANYWNITNASYTSPCNTSYYDNCKHEAVVEKLPAMTFSAANFSNGIGISSPIYTNENEQTKKRNGIVYDLNILSMFDDDLINQVTALHAMVGKDNVKYIELGNEYYLNRYEYEFPNSTVYINKALPVINEIRKLFGNSNNTKISVPADKALPGQPNKWNDQLVNFKDYFDSVTIHDYTMQNSLNGLDEEQQLSVMAIYGRAALPQWIEYVNQRFGTDKSIFMTEYNTGGSNQTFGYSVLHTMFAMSYITSAICDNTKSMELLMWHLYATQTPANAWGTFDFVTSFSDWPPNDVNGATFNVVGQILAQIGYISMIKNNRMTCMNFKDTGNNNMECPLLGFEVMGNDKLQCLFGAGFNNDNDNNSFGFVVVNACHLEINMDLELKSMADLNTNVVLNVYQYDYKGDGGNNNKFIHCKKGDNVWDEECAAVYADYQRINLSSNQQTLSTKINGMSLILAVTH